jgi:hypothetical protein
MPARSEVVVTESAAKVSLRDAVEIPIHELPARVSRIMHARASGISAFFI